MPIKSTLRRLLAERGWFIRRSDSLPFGVFLSRDLATIAGLPSPRIIFDVGAHHGESCDRFAEEFPTASIHAFEPVRITYQNLVTHLASRASVSAHQLALGARDEIVSIALQSDTQGNSLSHLAPPGSPNAESITVTTLDAFCSSRSISHIDLLKIDAEGHELAVLTGAREALARRAIGPIFAEATLDEADSSHTPLQALITHLRPYGYSLAAIYDQDTWRNPSRLGYFNALFVPSS